MGARHSPWIDEKAALLVAALCDRHGLTLSDDTARNEISDHLDHVATMMRIGRQAAKFYITDKVICDMADKLASVVRRHQDAIDRGDVADLDARRQFPG